jgi:hypothetical protein
LRPRSVATALSFSSLALNWVWVNLPLYKEYLGEPMEPSSNTLPRSISHTVPLRNIPKGLNQRHETKLSLLNQRIPVKPKQPRYPTNDIIQNMHKRA